MQQSEQERAIFFGYTKQNSALVYLYSLSGCSSICVPAALNILIQIGCHVKFVESFSQLFERCFCHYVRGL